MVDGSFVQRGRSSRRGQAENCKFFVVLKMGSGRYLLLLRRYVIRSSFWAGRSARDKAIFIAAELGRFERRRQGASRCYQKN